MARLIVNPSYDYFYFLDELRTLEEHAASLHAYLVDHLETVGSLLEQGTWLADDHNLALKTIHELEVEDGAPQTVYVQFADRRDPTKWVCSFIARLRKQNVQSQLDNAITLLANRQRAKYNLWCVRAAEIRAQVEDQRTDQVFLEVVSPKIESRLRGLLHLMGKKVQYEEKGQWSEAQTLIRNEVERTYLGRLLRDARERLDGSLVALPVAESVPHAKEVEDGDVIE